MRSLSVVGPTADPCRSSGSSVVRTEGAPGHPLVHQQSSASLRLGVDATGCEDRIVVRAPECSYRAGTAAGGRGTDRPVVVAVALLDGGCDLPGCDLLRGGVSSDCR